MSARIAAGTSVHGRRAAMVASAVCAIAAIPTLVLHGLGPGRPLRDDLFGGVGGASFVVLSLAYACVGAVVAASVPENPIGWMFCVTGLAYGLGMLGYEYARYGLYATAEPLAGASALAALPTEPIAGLLGLTLLLFPDGHLPSPRWRLAAATLILAMALLAVTDLLRPGPLDDPFATVVNPLGVLGWLGAANALNLAGWVLVMGIGLIGLSFAAFPVAAGVAILRYRLYDIDVVINRTLVYSTLTATLAAAYLASVLLLQVALEPLTENSGLAIATSTLAVAALFRPARARIQTLVDRRFYRRRYDTQRTLEAFTARVRDEVGLDTLSADLREVVAETMQPAHVSLWLRAPRLPQRTSKPA
jgi:hypothetical protein